MFTKNELVKIKEAINTSIAQRITIQSHITHEIIREEAEKSLEDDYKLLDKVLSLLER